MDSNSAVGDRTDVAAVHRIEFDVDWPPGFASVFVLDGAELRLVDEGDDTLLRAPREGVERDWVDSAVRLRGTMTVVVDGDAPDPGLTPGGLVAAVDDAAAHGRVVGAIVGVHLESTRLPLIF